MSTIADAEPEALALRGYAAGISDDGTVIAGRVKHTSSGPATPAVWLGPDWTQIDLELPAGFIAGHARDVNNSGVIVGATKNGVDTLATTWASPSAAATLLERPAGFRSKARGLNNQGYIVGYMWDPSTERSMRAVLWRLDGSWCTLHPEGQQEESFAYRIDDVVDGTVLVAGQVLPADQPAIWTVDVTACSFVYETVGIGAGSAADVRRVGDGWIAVGRDRTSQNLQAAVWTSGGDGQALDTRPSLALVVNSVGYVVGVRFLGGVDRAVLWVK